MCGNPELTAKERQLLQQIVQTGTCELWPRVASELQHYRWQDGDHQVIFEALNRVEPTPDASLRKLLTAETTRMGFPDIDWNQYFSPSSKQTPIGADESLPSVTDLVRELKSTTTPE